MLWPSVACLRSSCPVSQAVPSAGRVLRDIGCEDAYRQIDRYKKDRYIYIYVYTYIHRYLQICIYIGISYIPILHSEWIPGGRRDEGGYLNLPR